MPRSDSGMTNRYKTEQIWELSFAVTVERSESPIGGAPDPMTASNLAIESVRGSSLSSLDGIPQSMELKLLTTLDGLINSWCERRVLRPLAYLLPAYPGALAHTDQQFQLLEALKNLKRLRLDLTPEELRLVIQAHDLVDERLRASVV